MAHIVVTKHHINIGDQGDPVSCPIARAIREKMIASGDYNVFGLGVYSEEVKIEMKDYDETYELPEIAQSFIRRFDDADIPENMEPIEFDIEGFEV